MVPTLLCIFAVIDEPTFFYTGAWNLYTFAATYVRILIMDHRANLETLACPRHTYTDATIEEGPNTPDKLVSGLSTYCEEDQEEMWMVPVQEKGPHLPEELAVTTC